MSGTRFSQCASEKGWRPLRFLGPKRNEKKTLQPHKRTVNVMVGRTVELCKAFCPSKQCNTLAHCTTDLPAFFST